MSGPQADATTDTSAIIAALRAERDAALVEKTALTEELAARTAQLAKRDSDYGERIDHQAATLDVLRAMSASPGDAQPVFNLIVRRARELCNGEGAGLLEFDGELVHSRAWFGQDQTDISAYSSLFPMTPSRASIACRAIMDAQIIHIRDAHEEPELLQVVRDSGLRSLLALPLLRDGKAIGAIALNAMEPGGFTDSQVALLQTLAEQAVIAITSAETYRILQTRTSDLQKTLEYQTAISDVLKVISRSAFDLQPVLDAVVKTAARLCNAEQAVIVRREGELMQLAANHGFPLEYEALLKGRGLIPIDRAPRNVGPRAIREGRVVHVHDAATEPGYTETAVTVGKQRTSLGVPLLREGEVIGSILLARQRVEPFTDQQIELVSTFADQAVIAIENTRLMTEQREALEQQTATAEVLQVINSSPGDLTPVFDAMVERAATLCKADEAAVRTFDGSVLTLVATHGPAGTFQELKRLGPSYPDGLYEAIAQGASVTHFVDVRETEAFQTNARARERLELRGIRSWLAVALRKEGALLGVINVHRREARPFTDKQIALLQNFAAQAVIAMENARLLTEQREALEQQTATAEVLQAINASPGDLAPVFEAILDKAHTLCGATLGSLFLFDGELFRAVATHGYPEDLAQRLRQGVIHAATAQLLDASVPWVHNPDLTLVGGPTARVVSERGGVRTNLMVPLRKDGKLLGTISCNRREVRLFTDKEIALIQNFAAQAVIAMENARLLTEQREALEQQTATAEVLQVINASPGNLTPVFDAILQKAMRLCDAAFGSLYTYDGEGFHSAAHLGVPKAYEEWRATVPPSPRSTVPARILKEKRSIHIIDLMQEDDYAAGDVVLHKMSELGGIRTALSVPLLKDDVVLGFVTIFRQEVHAFSNKQIVLLESFAAQAVIAMENARLLNEQREALEQQTATAEVLQVINASPGNLTPVFDAILEKAHSLCGAVTGSLQLCDSGFFRAVATRGLPEELVNILRQPRRSGIRDAFLHDAPFVQIADIADPVLSGGDKTLAAVHDIAGVRTLLRVPLRKDDALLGVIIAGRREVRPFSQQEISLLQSFAAQAVIAMENARLLDEIGQRQEELRITFENMGDGVALFDETRHLVASNRRFQEMLDVPDDVISARPAFADYIRYLADRGEYGLDAEEHVQRLLSVGGQPAAFERTRPNGRIIEVRSNPVPSGGFVVIYRDITERKRSEEEIRASRDAAEEASRTIETAYRDLKAAQANLIQAEKMASLGQLTAGIAHEIKNPLNFVNNFAALSVDLLDELKEAAAPGFASLSEKQRAEVDDVSAMLTSNLEKITEHGKRADDIVKAMLEHSRGSSGERRKVDINTLADEALNLAYHGARAQGQSFNISLERDFAEGIAPIELAPQDVTRVLLNLFSNGFYAATRRARQGGDAGFMPTLKVTTRDAGEAVEVRVRDNGIGISADIKDKLFQPFFTTKPTGEGTGLGLSISYDIITQQHGGTIAVESKPNSFTEFTVTIPRGLAKAA